jgi:hypothetical protein
MLFKGRFHKPHVDGDEPVGRERPEYPQLHRKILTKFKMSGVTEVRLYRFTVGTVLAEYTNITATVINSWLKDHATGINRYLDAIVTVYGLSGGTTYYLWDELIDARGNTAEPQPIGATRRMFHLATWFLNLFLHTRVGLL